MDWGAGRYEAIAEGLGEAAQVLVDRSAPQAGELVADVGCGTGSAALAAARLGARVVGVDPAERLVGVAARHAGPLEAVFLRGLAGALPLRDRAADLVLSAFGVIFAPDPRAALAEMARVAVPAGRLALSAWHPGGALADIGAIRREALVGPAGPQESAPFAWHDADALDALLAPSRFRVDATDHHLAFTASSPDAFLEAELRDHPLWVEARRVLELQGRWAPVVARARAALLDANEDPAAFKVTSTYTTVVARRR